MEDGAGKSALRDCRQGGNSLDDGSGGLRRNWSHSRQTVFNQSKWSFSRVRRLRRVMRRWCRGAHLRSPRTSLSLARRCAMRQFQFCCRWDELDNNGIWNSNDAEVKLFCLCRVLFPRGGKVRLVRITCGEQSLLSGESEGMSPSRLGRQGHEKSSV